ncbi:methyl jasmonate esterase 1-like [Euphorbia lathyris]|uniref:methyl jasmonate esterase 1-like n=1 Tax=Euphorbia lathyris TaxID=212925 RepID=UPI00331310B7
MLLKSPLLNSPSLKTTTTQKRVSNFRSERSSSKNLACKNNLKCDSGGQRHFVLIHGACHGAWCWYKVSPLLKSAGHNVSALDMAASGVNPRKVEDLRSFSDYFEPLMEFMANLSAEERVILVGHSMGGIGISMAMEKFTEKISAAVFAAASMPGSDFPYQTIAAKYAERSKSSKSKPMDTKLIFGNGPNNPPTAIVLGPNQMATNLYHFSPPQDLELATLLVRPFPVFSNEVAENEIVVTKERHGLVPRIFIICDEENDEEQRWMVLNNPPHELKIISGSDHMVMLSKPQELASYLLEIGQKYV